MDQIAKPTSEDLRKAQAALDALNVAYEYFTPLRTTPEQTSADYHPYGRAA